jgi:hypothetical protein
MQRNSCTKEHPLEVRSKPGANYCAGLCSWRRIEVFCYGAAILRQDAAGQTETGEKMFVSPRDSAGAT